MLNVSCVYVAQFYRLSVRLLFRRVRRADGTTKK